VGEVALATEDSADSPIFPATAERQANVEEASKRFESLAGITAGPAVSLSLEKADCEERKR